MESWLVHRRSFVGALIASGLAGCVRGSRETTHTGASTGTIVASRRIPFAGQSGTSRGLVAYDVRPSILAALGDPAPARPAGGGAMTEFIVRENDGRIISVVQSDAPSLLTGRRVMIVHGADVRLMPAR